MASRTISLKESAYEALRQAKRPGESFSKVVHRLLRPANDPLRRMTGLLDPVKGEAMRELLDAKRSMDRDESMERYRRLGLL